MVYTFKNTNENIYHIWYCIIWHCMTYYNVIRFGLEMPVPCGFIIAWIVWNVLIIHSIHTYMCIYIYIPVFIYIYIFMDHLLLRSCPLPGKKPGGIFPCKSPRKDGDEERGLPDWYTKHLEEDLHALGLPNRLGNPGGWPNRLRGCEVQEMDSKGDQGWISKDALLYIFAKKHLNILERTFDYNTLA